MYTDYRISKNVVHTGADCTNCGTSYRRCSEDLFEHGGFPCCGECEQYDTHDAQRGTISARSVTEGGVADVEVSPEMQAILSSIPDEFLLAEVKRRGLR